eukprot:1342308-Pleurochrysis_carterae.AAC.2
MLRLFSPRRGGHGAAADLVQFNVDTQLGHTALALMLDAAASRGERAALWDKALLMLQCHRQGVPTLLGLCVVAVAQKTDLSEAQIAQRLPRGLPKYVLTLREWASNKLGGGAKGRSQPQEKATYGECPKSPLPRLTWVQAAEALQTMRFLDSKFGIVSESDRRA